MAARPNLQTIVRTMYFIFAALFFLVAIRFVFHVGDTPSLPVQGAEVASMRGDTMLELYHTLPNRTQDVISVSYNGSTSHALNTVRGPYQFTKTMILSANLLQRLTTLHDTWCQQPPALPDQVNSSMLQLRLSCTTFTGRYFYIPDGQVPAVLTELMQVVPSITD